jgi:hypothetical protein
MANVMPTDTTAVLQLPPGLLFATMVFFSSLAFTVLESAMAARGLPNRESLLGGSKAGIEGTLRSIAMAAMPAIDAFLKEKGLAGRAATHSSTAPVLDWYAKTQFGLGKEAIPYNNAVFSYIQKQQIRNVIMIAAWRSSIEGPGGNPSTFGEALLVTIQRLVAIGSRPYILLDVPDHPFDVPRALSRSMVSRVNLDSLSSKPIPRREFDALNSKVVSEIEAAGGRFLDPKPSFLDSRGHYYIVQFKGIALYSDEQHLSTKGARLILLPFLRDSLLR